VVLLVLDGGDSLRCWENEVEIEVEVEFELGVEDVWRGN